ncbi:MAG: hypothetical protein LBQ01_00910 [Prevotellaceae bacterium]|jgi:hypothetical protein|nr:hypothetical protein [Prevotellaceae bacterium]
MHRFRYREYFTVSIDGTGIYSYDYEPWKGCPYRESKKGKKTRTVNVVEAKLVCSNGFAISPGTEWEKPVTVTVSVWKEPESDTQRDRVP